MAAAVAVQQQQQPPGVHSGPMPVASSTALQVQSALDDSEMMMRAKSADVAPDTPNVRARRDRPCDLCRRRRSRCVIQEPHGRCLSCQSHNWDCTFVEDPQPRKRKLDSDGNPLKASKKKSLRPAERSESLGHASTLARSFNATNGSSRNSVLSDYDASMLRRHCVGRHIGSTTTFEPLLFRNVPFDFNGESYLDSGILVNLENHGPYMLRPTLERNADEREALKNVESHVQPHGSTLVDLYFNIVHPSYPILDQNVFRTWYRQGTGLAPELLAAVYILASQWWNHDDILCHHPRPNLSQLLFDTLKRMRDSLDTPTISAIQAGLLLSQLPEVHSSSLTAQLVTTGFDLGLHLDCSGWRLPPWQIRVRKRIAWALYMQDKWSSVIYGRPSHINGANWGVPFLLLDDFEQIVSPFPIIKAEDGSDLETSDVEKGYLQFQQMALLTMILSDILTSFYTLSAMTEVKKAGANGTKLILDRAKPVQIRLKEWFTHLPPCLKMDSPFTSSLCPIGSLHIAYFATEITLHRTIIRSLPLSTPSQLESPSYLTHICRQAAKTRLISALDFTNRLRQPHLSAFWFFASPSNFALVASFGNLLRATAPCKEEEIFYGRRLREFRWTLGVNLELTERDPSYSYGISHSSMMSNGHVNLNSNLQGDALAPALASAPGILDLSHAILALEQSSALLELWPSKPPISALPPPPLPVPSVRSRPHGLGVSFGTTPISGTLSPPSEEDEDEGEGDEDEEEEEQESTSPSRRRVLSSREVGLFDSPNCGDDEMGDADGAANISTGSDGRSIRGNCESGLRLLTAAATAEEWRSET